MKILVLTSIYKGPNIPDEFTSVVHYFTKEWVSNDNEVIVIHNIAYYNLFFYFLSFLFGKLIASITGTNIPRKIIKKERDYIIDQVRVIRLPMYKSIPYSKFKKKIISNQLDLIYAKLEDNNFTPDLIIGHWGNPQFELLKSMKIKLNNVKTVLVLHSNGEKLKKMYKNSFIEDIKYIDKIGFRNNSHRKSFLASNDKMNTFLCHSGIPEYFISSENLTINSNFKSFIFIGTLIKRKFPEIIVDSLYSVFGKNFDLQYVGSGSMSISIKNKIKRLNLKRVKILGNISRFKVKTYLDLADCFIMISEGEAFGLVYLEAMSRGCITIASKNEGMDGIIKDGINGFLCESGNQFDLENKLRLISSLSENKIKEIKKNAILTAQEFTNKKAANKYLNLIYNETPTLNN
jgi:glycosyltransferase involved in cell wall biosynthesis